MTPPPPPHEHHRRLLSPVDLSAGDGGDDVRKLIELLQQTRRDLADHVEREEELFASAFPHGDPVSHRAAHESMIAASAAQEKFWSELRLDIAKKGIWGLLIIVLGLVAVGAATKLGIRP